MRISMSPIIRGEYCLAVPGKGQNGMPLYPTLQFIQVLHTYISSDEHCFVL